MKNTLVVRLVGLVLGVLAAASGAVANVVEMPLNCAGHYDVNTPAWTMDFDLGVTFSEISHVYIDWSGEISGVLIIDGLGGPPYEPEPVDGYLYACLGVYPLLQDALMGGGAFTYPDPEPFDVLSEFSLLEAGTWDNLLDGRGNISIVYSTFIVIPEIYIIDSGSVSLNDATLVVDGTIIPEPATLILLGLGLLPILRQKQYSCISKQG